MVKLNRNITDNLPLDHTRVLYNYAWDNLLLQCNALSKTNIIMLKNKSDYDFIEKLWLIYNKTKDGQIEISTYMLLVADFAEELYLLDIGESRILAIVKEFIDRFVINNKQKPFSYILELYILACLWSQEINVYIFKDWINVFTNIEYQSLLKGIAEKKNHICVNLGVLIAKYVDKNIELKEETLTPLTEDMNRLLQPLLETRYTLKEVVVKYRDGEPYQIIKKWVADYTWEKFHELDTQLFFWNIGKKKHIWKTEYITVEEIIPMRSMIEKNKNDN